MNKPLNPLYCEIYERLQGLIQPQMLDVMYKMGEYDGCMMVAIPRFATECPDGVYARLRSVLVRARSECLEAKYVYYTSTDFVVGVVLMEYHIPNMLQIVANQIVRFIVNEEQPPYTRRPELLRPGPDNDANLLYVLETITSS